ncbi:MAG TPA: hypothetical protein VN132_03990, partial [Bdellovibrio sp.]|nr:hypothetical protein [Bdellovibrio sp.]
PSAKEVACRQEMTPNLASLEGVVRMGGMTYARSEEPAYPSNLDLSKKPDSVSMQWGHNFSFGGWIKFARPQSELNFDTDSRYNTLHNGLVPDYYYFLSKSVDNSRPNPANAANEWQFYVNAETLYLGTFQGNTPNYYYDLSRIESGYFQKYKQYQACVDNKEAALQAYYTCQNQSGSKGKAIANKKSTKPLPPVPPPPQCPPPPTTPCEPPVVVIPPPPPGDTKFHLYDYDVRLSFAHGETFSSSYLDYPGQNTDHYQAWHFVNVSFDLQDRLNPHATITMIALPYNDRHPIERNVVDKCIMAQKDGRWIVGRQCRMKSTLQEFINDYVNGRGPLPFLMNESNAAVLIGKGRLEYDLQKGLQRDDRIYRSGIYISRKALNEQEVLKMARVLYPKAAVNCLSSELKTLIPSSKDLGPERER